MAWRKHSWVPPALATAFGVAVCLGCSRDVRLAGREIPTVSVRTVTLYGVTLDEHATPEQVAYVALRAIRDDFLASSRAAREDALEKQFDVSAAKLIESRNRTSLSRDEYVYHVVYRWTPTVSHYVHDFATDWEAAKARLIRRDSVTEGSSDEDVRECEVRMEVDDPSGDPNARVVLVVWLAKDSGFWRVLHLGFDRTRRSVVGTELSADG